MYTFLLLFKMIFLGADYIRDTDSLLAHLDLPKTSQAWKHFFLYDEKMYPVHKLTKPVLNLLLFF